MVKSPDAFRTISEVADWLGIQAHVLRFWESKFTQVKPIKRAGGRRYYRPADMLLLGGIKKLLHDDGLTIKGVQKILREDGMTHVAALSAPLEDMPAPAEPTARPAPAPRETGVVLNFGTTAEPAPLPDDARSATPDSERSDAPQPTDRDRPASDRPAAMASTPEITSEPQADAAATESPAEPAPTAARLPAQSAPPAPQPPEDNHPTATPDPLAPSEGTTPDAPQIAAPQAAPLSPEPAPGEAAETNALPSFLRRPLGAADATETRAAPKPPLAEPADPAQSAATSKVSSQDTGVSQPPAAQEAPAEPIPSEEDDTPKPLVIDLPAFTPEADFPARPGLLSRASRLRRLPRAVQPDVASLLLQLADRRLQMDPGPVGESNH